jgi:hypothetical protein
MVDKLAIWTETRQMAGMKASSLAPRVSNHYKIEILSMLVIYPLDYKRKGHILDDVISGFQFIFV